jgi:pilus assembly protein CpaF
MPIIIKVGSTKDSKSQQLNFTKTFAKNEVSIGRAPDNDVLLPDLQVSGRHARLTLEFPPNVTEPVLSITDIGSSNGTFVEHERLPTMSPRKLISGERVVIGCFVLIPTVLDSEGTSTFNATKTESEEEPIELLQRDNQRFEEELQIKRVIHDRLIEKLDLRRKDIISLSEIELRLKAQQAIEQTLIELRWTIPEGLERDRLIKEILDEALGLGPLEILLADETVSEIMVNSFDMIYAEQNGKLNLTQHRFSSEQAVLGAIERILAPIGRRIDESSPLVDARLKDGSRVNAVIRPLALNGPCITIRKFAKNPLTVADLVKFGSMSKGMAEFLKLAVENRLNTVISGGTGSGKTTLLNVISSFIPDGQRLITVEDAAELRLPQEHLISFETRPPNLEGKGAITIRDLVRNALRMRPDRIIVGECRGAEALDMLQAMNTGHDGSLTTGHANSPEDMIARLETMVLMAGLDLPVRAIREQIASAVNLVVQQTRFSCGTRKVTAITEVVGIDRDEGSVLLQDIFKFRQDGYGTDGKVRGVHQASGYIPMFFRKLQERGLPVNADVFAPE